MEGRYKGKLPQGRPPSAQGGGIGESAVHDSGELNMDFTSTFHEPPEVADDNRIRSHFEGVFF